MLSKNVDIVKGRVVFITDASSFREEDHPRGQPGNAGQFGPGGGSSESKRVRAEKAEGKEKKEPGATTRIKKKEKLEKRKGRRAEKKGEVAEMLKLFRLRGGQLSDRVKPIKLREMKKRLAALEAGGGSALTHSPKVTGAATTGGGAPSSLEKAIYSHPTLKLKTVFENGEVESWKISDKGGINTVYEAIIKGDGMGMTKSSVDEAKGMEDQRSNIRSVANSCKSRMKTDLWACSQTRREIMASEIDKLLGAGFIPSTVAKTIEGKGLCSCQTFVEGFQQGVKPANDIRIVDKIYEAVCFDEIIGSSDRHGGNHGLDSNGNIVFIDNGLTFNAYPKEAWNGPYEKYVAWPTGVPQSWKGGMYINALGYRKACKKFTDKAYENKDVIDKIFKHHGLPELEQEQFWGRVERRKALGEKEL